MKLLMQLNILTRYLLIIPIFEMTLSYYKKRLFSELLTSL
jgi:hypothetical protein